MKAAKYGLVQQQQVKCLLCPHHCLLSLHQTGRCRVRRLTEKGFVSLNYGEVSAMRFDPVEKKPLNRFMPGTFTFSIGSYGCNFKCDFCQNYHIAMEHPETLTLSPGSVVQKTLEAGVPSLSFTYNEPIVSYEFVLDTAALAKEKGLVVILVTNGYICQEPLQELLPYVDAMNIDLKAFTETAYQRFCGGSLQPVLDTIETAAGQCHVELTTLLVPGMHGEGEVEEMAKWIASLSPDIPYHLSRYFPRYHFHEPATSIEEVLEAKSVAQQYLHHVYTGNI